APGTWIGIVVVYFLVYMGMGLIPFIGSLASAILNPVFLAGFVIAASNQAEGKNIEVSTLFEGFKRNAGGLVVLGLIYFGGIIIMIPVFVVGGASVFAAMGKGNFDEMFGVGLIVAFLIAFAGMIVLAMAFYWAPTLVALQNMPALSAMRSSLLASLKNILPWL